LLAWLGNAENGSQVVPEELGVVGEGVTGAAVVGAEVTGAAVVGAEVTGAAVVGAEVTGAAVVGETVTGAEVVGGDPPEELSKPTQAGVLVGGDAQLTPNGQQVNWLPTLLKHCEEISLRL
jgi:hypothetical protein